MTTKFNPKGKDTLTYGEALDPAMGITDKEDAEQYFRDYVAYLEGHLEKEPRDDDMTAEQVALVNIGYYAGYCDIETQRRVQKLFGAIHPIFGRIKD